MKSVIIVKNEDKLSLILDLKFISRKKSHCMAVVNQVMGTEFEFSLTSILAVNINEVLS